MNAIKEYVEKEVFVKLKEVTLFNTTADEGYLNTTALAAFEKEGNATWKTRMFDSEMTLAWLDAYRIFVMSFRNSDRNA